MKKHLILFIFATIGLNIHFCSAENDTILTMEKDSNYVYQITEVDKKPEFIGGNDALLKFIAKTLKLPPIYQESAGQSNVICQFIIEKDGSISNITIVKKSFDSLFDKEAIRILELMPNWTSAEKNGSKVRCYYTIPIRFKF